MREVAPVLCIFLLENPELHHTVNFDKVGPHLRRVGHLTIYRKVGQLLKGLEGDKLFNIKLKKCLRRGRVGYCETEHRLGVLSDQQS